MRVKGVIMSLALNYWMGDACRLRNDLYCVEWDVEHYYTIPLKCGYGEEWKTSADLRQLLMRKLSRGIRRLANAETLFGKWNSDGLAMFWDTTEFCMKLLKAEWKRRMQMLRNLADDGGYAALKWAAEDREGWRHRERVLKTCCIAENYWWLLVFWAERCLFVWCLSCNAFTLYLWWWEGRPAQWCFT